MKKLLIGGVSLMIILSLVACSKNEDKNVGDTNTPGIESNVDNNTQNSNKDEAGNTDLSQIIIDSRDEDINEAMSIVDSSEHQDAEIVFSMLEIDENDLSEYAISLSPMNVKAYCVAIVKPVEGKKDAIKQAFETYKLSQEQAFEQYLQDQYKIAQDAVITEVGDYIVFAMCEDSSTFRDNVVNKLK